MIRDIFLVGLGGGIGSIARFLCHRGMLMAFPGSSFPAGTFLVNAVGCFVIGLLWSMFARSNDQFESGRLFLMTGLCGGFTTFSAFTLESVGLLKDNKTGMFLLYAGLSVMIGLLATWAGMKLIRG